jgi:preprotein translocase subunit SecG
MFTFILWVLTAVLFLDCLLLGLLILVQLPKKEAGMGMAFGGGAADALFGAGSGNTLTKLTKYCAGIFLLLVLALSVMNTRARHANVDALDAAMKRQAAAGSRQAMPADTRQAEATTAAGGTNAGAAPIMSFSSNTVPLAGTNAVLIQPTNAGGASTNVSTNAPK